MTVSERMTEDFETDVDPHVWLTALAKKPQLAARLEDMVWVQYRVITRYDWVTDIGDELLADIEAMRP
jgi:hypothetical protein